MKSKFLSLLLFPIILMSCSKKVELTPVNMESVVVESENVTIQINPKTELFIIACSMADMQMFMYDEDDDYLNGVRKFFEKHTEHPLIKQLKALNKDYNGGFNSQLAVLRYISDDLTQFTGNKKNLPKDMLPFWNKVNMDEFLINFNDFAIQSNWERIWKLYNVNLKRQVVNVKEFYNVNNKVFPWVQEYFFNSDVECKFVINVHQKINNQGLIDCMKYDGDKVIFQIYEHPFIPSDVGNEVNFSFFLSDVAVYKIVLENWDKISENTKKWLTNTYNKLAIDSSKFDDDVYQADLTNPIAFMITENYVKEVYDSTLETELIDQIESICGMYENVEEIKSLLKIYENNREKYPTFEKFFQEVFVEEINAW